MFTEDAAQEGNLLYSVSLLTFFPTLLVLGLSQVLSLVWVVQSMSPAGSETGPFVRKETGLRSLILCFPLLVYVGSSDKAVVS